jgi:hypothetical protein
VQSCEIGKKFSNNLLEKGEKEYVGAVRSPNL